MKNKKIVIALFVLAVVLLGGFAANSLQGIFAEGDTYNVVIKYQTLAAEGSPTLYKTFTEEYSEGEQINIKSPEIKGYKPNKANVSAVVKSDLYLTVNYSCLHSGEFDESLDEVVTYPTADTVGIIKHYCDTCDGYYQEEFITLTRTFTFGGESVRELSAQGQVVDGYGIPSDNEKVFVLLKDYLPELDIIFDGLSGFDGKTGLSDAATVTFTYDEEAWNNANLIYKKSPEIPAVADADYSFRFGNGWRIVFGFEGRSDGSLPDFIFSDDCPLITAPLTITLTYDYTK